MRGASRRGARILGAAAAVAALAVSGPVRGQGSSEAEKLRVDPTISLEGKPFPEIEESPARFAEPRRVFYVSADAKVEGDGSETRPWKELQAALCRLEPGDRLVLLPGLYSGAVRIGESCKPGRADAPIQVFGEEAFFHAAEGAFALTVSRPFWHFYHMQMVLDRPGAKGFAVLGEDAHDIVFDRGHVYEGAGVAILLGSGSARISISNSHVHQSGGIRIEAGARDVELHHNKIHHNLDAALRVVPGGKNGGIAQNLTLTRNKFHNDTGPALDLSRCRGVRVEANKIYNYRPGPGSRGEAVVLGPGAEDIVITGSYFAEATVGVRVNGAAKVLLLRNYFENMLSEQSTALEIVAGRDIDILGNTIDRYAVGIRVEGRPPGVAGIRFANNLVLDASVLPFDLEDSGAAADFGHNAFGGPAGTVRGRIGGKTFDIGRGDPALLPGSRVAAGVRLSGRDLANVEGLVVRDAGKAFDGVTFSGAAPDIGVAEK